MFIFERKSSGCRSDWIFVPTEMNKISELDMDSLLIGLLALIHFSVGVE